MNSKYKLRLFFISTLFFSQTVLANSADITPGNVTIGIDAISDSTTRTWHLHSDSMGSVKVDQSGDASGVRLRLLTRINADDALEFYFSRYDTDSNFGGEPGDETDLGVNLVIHGAPNIFTPFGKVGVGIGFAPARFVSGDDDFVANAHLNVALGVKLTLTDDLTLVGSVEATYRSWEKVAVGAPFDTADIADDVFRSSLGIEYSF